MYVDELYNKLKLMKNKRDRPMYLVFGDSNLILEVDTITEAKNFLEDEDGTKEAIDAAGIDKNALIIRL